MDQIETFGGRQELADKVRNEWDKPGRYTLVYPN